MLRCESREATESNEIVEMVGCGKDEEIWWARTCKLKVSTGTVAQSSEIN